MKAATQRSPVSDGSRVSPPVVPGGAALVRCAGTGSAVAAAGGSVAGRGMLGYFLESGRTAARTAVSPAVRARLRECRTVDACVESGARGGMN
ncbi:hypothetical protein Apa02nite_083950 [Actinoplanes palleronii]|uniref:Uncharacterized protein n=1 Tax=Actinoplanes palleronii TaxID=113570 RepID=A0ABQ4BNM1_9ACTN|nr:hypothetical protein Apa02nite_083950 [Actinoplanes palleronii]